MDVELQAVLAGEALRSFESVAPREGNTLGAVVGEALVEGEDHAVEGRGAVVADLQRTVEEVVDGRVERFGGSHGVGGVAVGLARSIRPHFGPHPQ